MNQARAKQLRPEAQIHTFHGDASVDIDPLINMPDGTSMPASQMIIPDKIINVNRKLSANVQINSNVSINSSFFVTQNANIDFKIEATDELMLHGVIGKLVLTNTTGGPLTPNPVLQAFNPIEHWVNNMALRVDYIEDPDIYATRYRALTTEQVSLLQAVENVSAVSYDANAAIPAGATVTYFFAVEGPYVDHPMWMGAFKNWTIRFRASGDSIEGAGPVIAGIAVSDFTIRLMADELSNLDQAHLRAKYAKQPVGHRFLAHAYETFSQTLAANSSFNFKLNSLKGVSPEMVIYLRKRPFTNNNQKHIFFGADVSTIHMFDNNGRSLMEGLALDQALVKSHMALAADPSAFQFQKDILIIPFAEGGHNLSRASGGKNFGYETFYDNLVTLVTSASATATAYEIKFAIKPYATLYFMPNKEVRVIYS